MIALIGLDLPDRINGQIFTRPQPHIFRHGSYNTRNLEVESGLPFWATIRYQRRLFRTPASCSVFPRSDSKALSWRSPLLALAVATPRVRFPTTASTSSPAAPRASQFSSRPRGRGLGLTPTSGFISSASLQPPRSTARREPRARAAGRPLVAIRDQPIAGETMGIDARSQDRLLRREPLYAGVAGGSARSRSAAPSPRASGCRFRSPFWSASSSAALAPSAAPCSEPCSFSSCPISPTSCGQFRRRRRRCRARLTACCDTCDRCDADWSRGRRAVGGASARLRSRDEARAKTGRSGGASVAANYEGKGKSP